MYGGHIGVALGAHGLRRTVPLWFLIVASQLPDWTDAAFCMAGARPEPIGILSHSLPAVVILAAVAAAAYAIRSRDIAGMLLVAAVVISHTVGDYVTGVKPTWSGGPMIGLMWYRRPMLDFLFESLVIAGGWLIYRRSLDVSRRSSEPVFTLLAALIVVQAAADVFFSLAKGLKKC